MSLKPASLARLDRAAPGPWRFWWLAIALSSLAGWAGVALLGSVVAHLLP